MKLVLLSVMLVSLGAVGTAFAPAQFPASSDNAVVLPLKKMRPFAPGVPEDADYRVRSVNGALLYASCDRQRAYPDGEVAFGCRLYGDENKLTNAVQWYSAGALYSLTDDTNALTTASLTLKSVGS